MHKDLLITGITGFVGGNLKTFLIDSGYTTIEGVTREVDYSDNNIIDYEEFFNTGNYTYYIHLAGKAHDTDYSTNRDEFFKVNLDLTKKVYQKFLDDPSSKQFIFASSVAAVASNTKEPLTESINPEPNGFYGESKLAAEAHIMESIPPDKDVYILRPPMIHGPGNKGNLNLLYSIIRKGIPWPLGAFDTRRSFLSIENFCFVIHEILKGSLSSGIYNIADDESVSIQDLVTIIAEENQKKPRIWKIPKPFIQTIAKVGNVLRLPLNEERLEKLTENYVVSNQKLVKALGKPLPVKAEDGLRKTIRSFNY